MPRCWCAAVQQYVCGIPKQLRWKSTRFLLIRRYFGECVQHLPQRVNHMLRPISQLAFLAKFATKPSRRIATHGSINESCIDKLCADVCGRRVFTHFFASCDQASLLDEIKSLSQQRAQQCLCSNECLDKTVVKGRVRHPIPPMLFKSEYFVVTHLP